MNVALTVDPELPVPPKLYGGIERIVDMLVRGLDRDGHEVTLFAHPESEVPCDLTTYPATESRGLLPTLQNMSMVSSSVLARNFDLVHSFGRLGYLLPVLPLSIPKLMSYQRAIPARTVTWGERLSRGTLHFSGCSRHLIEPYAGRPNWHVVYNGVPIEKYSFEGQVADDAPLVFLGRVEHIKGTHHAIEVAQQTGRQLVIAGNVDEEHRDYFEEHVEPYLDGEQIQFIGPVDDEEKNDLLGRAAAFLMPILWEEPFGIVMAEALACGTPVIGLNRGSVPEVIEHGITGYVCTSVDEMIEAVEALGSIDRRACRRSMEEHFSDRAIVQGYKNVYRKMLGDDGSE